MISAKQLSAVSVLAIAGLVEAQDRTGGQSIAELIEQLDGADALRRDTAIHRLSDLGKPAATALMEALRAQSPMRPAYLRALGRMGPDAVDALGMLFGSLRTAESLDGFLEPVLEAILGILPFAEDRDARLVGQAQETLIAFQLALAERQDALRPLDEKILKSGEILVEAAAVNYDLSQLRSSIPDIMRWLEASAPSRAVRGQVVARVLGRTGEEGHAALPALRAYLDHGHRNGTRPVLIVPFAEAILAIDPESEQAIEAQGYLAVHGDLYQRQVAAAALRGLGERGAGAVQYLLVALESDSTDPRDLQELITTLGIIGPQARDALPVLEGLAGHQDPQIAERAKAALRQIKGGPDPGGIRREIRRRLS